MTETGQSILLVEDDAAIAELYAIRLRMEGFTVHRASDAATAQVIFRRVAPAVVCMDNRLPDASGAAIAESLISSGATVILLTNDQRSLEHPPLGVARTLLKSRTTPTLLTKTIEEILARNAQRAS